jgi:GNAT superfamily N-acetyltransferase
VPEPDIAIARVRDLAARPALLAQVEEILFATAARSYAPGPAREAFRERWLGRYLRGGGDVVLLALADARTVAGYLVGALENPAAQARFGDTGYFRTDFAQLCRDYPAHLHINLAAPFRSRGIGAQLIEAFAAHARAAGAPGMHVVTGKGMRNVGFYLRHGFVALGEARWNDNNILFLGRDLAT